MKPEDQLLFLCCRQDFQEAHQRAVLDLCRKHTIPWETVFSKAEQHGVAPLVFINLCQRGNLGLPIPAAVTDQYRKLTYRNAIRKEQRAQRVGQALEYFSQLSIDVLLIKGGVLDLLVYEHPAYVTSNDVDVVLRRKLEELEPDALQNLHRTMHGSGIEYDFYEHHDTTINGALPVDFQRIWDDAVRIDYHGKPVLVMCPEDMLISLCINSCRKRFFRLKSLLDIAETIAKIKTLDWGRFVEKSRSYDCGYIVYAALMVTCRTLGCALPPNVLDDLALNPSRASLIRSVIDFLLRFSSLPASPNKGRDVFGVQVHPSLLLVYASYRGYQIRRKLKEIIRSFPKTN